MKSTFDNILTELKILIQWLCWMYEENPNDPEHPKKPPINSVTGKKASSTVPATWGTFEDAIKRFNKGKVDGIGFVFSKDDPYCGIDLDNSRDQKTGKLKAWARKIVKTFDSYTEISPSGTGVHIIVKGKLSGKGKKVGDIEIYDKGRYFTFTGNVLPDSPLIIKKKQKALNTLYDSLRSKKLKKDSRKGTPPRPVGNSYVEIISKLAKKGSIEKFSSLHAGDRSGYNSRSEADLAYCSILSTVTDSVDVIDNLYRTSGLMRPKWDEPRGEQTYGKLTIDKALKNPRKDSAEVIAKDTPQFLVAQEVIKQLGRNNLYSHVGQLWIWDRKQGLWRKCADEEIKKQIHLTAHERNISQNHVNSILGLIKTETHSTVNKFLKIEKRVINCINGELHYLDKQWTLKPHNRKSNFIFQIPVKYDKTASRERFTKYLYEVFATDPDRDEKIRLLQEIMGYTLIRSCYLERWLLLIGNGSNGKSVFLHVLRELVGAENVSGVQPNQLEDRFTMAHLHGKLVNLITEIPEGAVLADAKLKSLVSGEMITAQHKFGKLFDFEPYATLIFSSNHLPHTKDFSYAFFRRVEILTFNRTFKEEEKDPDLKDKLSKEIPGILNFALAGLKRLFDRGDFTRVQSSLDMKKEWERSSDQVAAFVHEECELSPGAKIAIGCLFERYQAWAQESGFKTYVNKPNLTKRLIRLQCEPGRGAGGTRMIKGIRLKES